MDKFFARSVFFVDDAEAALRFYTETLGFSLEWSHLEEGQVWVFEVSLYGFQLMLNQADSSTASRVGQGRVFIGLDEEQIKALREHVERMGTRMSILQWGAPTLLIHDLDKNEILFGLPESERLSLQVSQTPPV